MLSGGVGQLQDALCGMPNSCFLSDKRGPGHLALTLGDSDGVFLKSLLRPRDSQPSKCLPTIAGQGSHFAVMDENWNISIVWEHPKLCWSSCRVKAGKAGRVPRC